MSRPNTPTYKTLNWPAYNKALKRRGSLTIWFDPDMSWAAQPTGKRGRQSDDSDAAVQTCLTMKVLFGMALRETTGFVESLLRLIGLDWDVPDFSTLSRRQKTLAVNILHRGSQGPLHLLIDSTGIKVEGEGEWNARKHGGAKRRVWRNHHAAAAPEMPRKATQERGRKSPQRLIPEPVTWGILRQHIWGILIQHLQSYRPARTPSRGRRSRQVRSRATRHCGHRNTSAARSGDDGVVTTAEAASKPRCIV